MYRPEDEMSDFTARRGYSPAFIAKVQAKRRAEALARQEELARQPAPVKFVVVEKPKADDAAARMVAPLWVKDVVRSVCERREVDAAMVLGKKRSEKYAYARQEIYYLLKSGASNPSFPQIAKWFGIDHTTAIYGAAVHAKRFGLPELTNYNVGRRKESLDRYHARQAMGRNLREAR